VRKGIAIPLLLVALASACGRKGPPLPPLVRRPAAPENFTAERRATRVDLHFTVPSANTDGTRPAYVDRVEVYALNSPGAVPPEQLLERGAAIARIQVKGPRDPNDVIGPNDPEEDLEPLTGPGLDQGATARVTEDLSSVASGDADAGLRLYVSVPVTRSGRRGPFSNTVAVRLTGAPPAPAAPLLKYDETSISVGWPAAEKASVVYHVYELVAANAKDTAAKDGAPPGSSDVRLTEGPANTSFVDRRIEWGVERCYLVRAVEVVEGLSIESEASPPACVTPRDTFPPAPPSGLETGPSEGAISLVWDAGKELDLAGYVVLRGDSSAGDLVPITKSLVQETGFTDKVPPGVRYVYAVQAVDKNGNVSAPSAKKEETAR
jgi:predicted small lipoprotein YifL